MTGKSSKDLAQFATVGGADSARLEAFRGTVYSMTKPGCASCHSSQGQRVTSFHGDNDISVAYDAAKQRSDFNNPSASLMVVKMNGHCGVDCGADKASLMAQNIDQWRIAESIIVDVPPPGGGGGPPPPPSGITFPIASLPIAMPSPLPISTGSADANFATMRIPLNSVVPANPDLAGVFLEFQIQLFNAPTTTVPGTYRIRKPRLATPTNAIRMQGIRFLINDVYLQQDNDYEGIDLVIAPGNTALVPLPFPILSTDNMLAIQRPFPAVSTLPDKVIVQFQRLERSTVPNCKNLAGFTASVRTVMNARCTGCHANTANNGFRRFSMVVADTDAVVCQRSLQRADVNVPASSPLVLNPQQGKNGHTVVQTFTAAEAQAFLNWIASEK